MISRALVKASRGRDTANGSKSSTPGWSDPGASAPSATRLMLDACYSRGPGNIQRKCVLFYGPFLRPGYLKRISITESNRRAGRPSRGGLPERITASCDGSVQASGLWVQPCPRLVAVACQVRYRQIHVVQSAED